MSISSLFGRILGVAVVVAFFGFVWPGKWRDELQAQEKTDWRIVQELPAEFVGHCTFLSEVRRMAKTNKAATTFYVWSVPGTHEWVICWKKGLWLPSGDRTVVYEDEGFGRFPLEIAADGGIVGIRIRSGGPKWYEYSSDGALSEEAVRLPIILEEPSRPK